MNEEKLYTTKYHCDNCDHSFNRQFAFGSLAAEMISCEKCGCNRAKKWDSYPSIPVAPVERIVIREVPVYVQPIQIHPIPQHYDPYPQPMRVWCGIPGSASHVNMQ